MRMLSKYPLVKFYVVILTLHIIRLVNCRNFQAIDVECSPAEAPRKASRIECVLICRRKDKAVVYADGMCYCEEKNTCSPANKRKEGVGGKSAVLIHPVPRSWEFIIDFHTRTVDVPVLADKKLYIDKKLSFTLWVKSKGDYSNHYFTYPRIENSNFEISQVFIETTSKLCYRSNGIVVFCTDYDDFKTKWTHIGFALSEDQSGVLTIKCYINGKLVKIETTNHRLGKPCTVAYQGLVLGNDVDNAEINNPNQFADAQIAELYMYNRVLTNDEIVSAYHHKASVEDRIVSWEEFSTALDGKTDVHIKPYPKELEF